MKIIANIINATNDLFIPNFLDFSDISSSVSTILTGLLLAIISVMIVINNANNKEVTTIINKLPLYP